MDLLFAENRPRSPEGSGNEGRKTPLIPYTLPGHRRGGDTPPTRKSRLSLGKKGEGHPQSGVFRNSLTRRGGHGEEEGGLSGKSEKRGGCVFHPREVVERE